MHPLRGATTDITYQDIFTGVIFNKPFTQLKSVDYPYKKYAAEKAYNEIVENKEKVNVNYLRQRFPGNEVYSDDSMRWSYEISRVNFIPLFFLCLMSSLIFLISTYHIIKIIIQKK